MDNTAQVSSNMVPSQQYRKEESREILDMHQEF